MESTLPYHELALQLALTSDAPLMLHVVGTSMLPTLQPADVVWVERVAPTALRRGDVVVVRHGSATLVHRLIAVGGRWQTLGDHCIAADPPCNAEEIIGRVHHAERNGQAVAFAQHAAWWGWIGATQHRLWQVHPLLSRLFRRLLRHS